MLETALCSTDARVAPRAPLRQPLHRQRDIAHLQRLAASHGPAIGAYATAVLDTPLPWSKVLQVYALLGLVKKWGPARSTPPASAPSTR